VLFPRVGPLWGMPSNDLSGRSGLSGQMRVGAMANIALSESIAMRIQWLTPQGEPPEQPQLYFRGPVLSHFDGSEWRRLGEDINGEWVDGIPMPAQLQVQGEGIRYRVTLEPHRQPWLLVMDAVPDRPELPTGQRSFMTADLQWLSTQPVMDVLRYEATSYPNFRHGPQQATSLDVRRLRTYTELPAGFNPRTLALAQSMRNDPAIVANPNADNTRVLINAALQRLRTGGYNYTLEPGVYGRNTADEFWFDRKEGFCEHIASAFVVLMRAMDIPARIVTGYQGGELNPVDGYWTIRQSDAHAWSEVWVSGEGWVRVDPTSAVAPGRTGAFQRLRPPRGALGGAMDAMISPGMLQNMRAVWEAVNNRWNQWVLNYSQNRQMDLLKSLGFSSPSWTDLAKVLAGLLVIVACAGAAWMAWERKHQDPWLRLLQNARLKLAKHGLSLPHTMPPRAMAQQVTTHYGAAGSSIAQWLLQLEQYRYAAPTSPNPKTNTRNQLAQLQRTWRQLSWPQKKRDAI
jgi:protein-glutamine gamma-glutamyltransferase